MNISILNDAVVEHQETFGVRLSASDQSVNLTQNTEATVVINDDTGRFKPTKFLLCTKYVRVNNNCYAPNC